MKVVINKCYGGFSLSEEGLLYWAGLQNIALWVAKHPDFKSMKVYWTVPPEKRPKPIDWNTATHAEKIAYNTLYDEQTIRESNLDRTDKYLVKTVEDLGADANGSHAELAVIEIPDDVKWEIEEYDGIETIREVSRSWG